MGSREGVANPLPCMESNTYAKGFQSTGRDYTELFASVTVSIVGMTCFPTPKRQSFANKTLKTKTNSVGVGFSLFSVHKSEVNHGPVSWQSNPHM